MLTFYSAIVLEAVCLMLILILMIHYNDILTQNKRTLFFILFSTIIVSTIAEWTGSLTFLSQNLSFLPDHIHHGIHVWTKVIELSLAPVTPFLCAEILSQYRQSEKKFKWYYYVLLIHAGLEILSAFSGFIFYVDKNSIFHHGPFYCIYMFTYLGASLYVLWSGYQISQLYQNRSRILLLLMLAYLLFGIAANQRNTNVKVAWLTVSIVVTLIYVFYNEMIYRVDDMTTLLNRTSYDNKLLRLREPVVILYLDVDSFKIVNDKHGHLYGDQCLSLIGKSIRNTYDKNGSCYRIGGDEFCVILQKDLDKTEKLNSRFFASMQEIRKKDPRFPYVSVGYVLFNPAKDNITDAVRAADAMMYRFKARNKIKYGAPYQPPISDPPLTIEQILDTLTENPPRQELDTSDLNDRIFTAFAGTTERNYYYICNMSTMVSRWSKSAVKYFDLPGEYMLDAGKIWESYIHPEDRDMYHEDITAVFTGRSSMHQLEYRVKNRYGEYVVCTCRGIVLKGENGESDLFAGTIINHGIIDGVDPVTGLHNNNEFTKSVHRMILEKTPACIIKIGIEHFRHINAMYGLEGGNRILKLFGMELLDLIHGKGNVFRLDGAKFAFYLYTANREEVLNIYRQVQKIAEEKIGIDHLRIPLRICGGAVFLGRHSYNDYTVRSSLIYAMEQSMEDLRGNLVFIEDIKYCGEIQNIRLHTDIHRDAINGCKCFFLCYQPIVSFSTNKIIGAEVLLRWKKEPYGTVFPDSFIPWLENDPSFIQVGNWILRNAIEQTRALREADPDFILNVNVSATQLESSNFCDDVFQILTETGCPPKNICLELTERCHRLDLEFLSGELKLFRSHGISIAIDDFGTGYSSLALVLQLPIDELKVDRMFVAHIQDNSNYLHTVEHILDGSRQMGCRTCVEGIETQEDYDLIKSIHGDCYQGYFSSRPITAEEFLGFYRKNSA